MNEEEKQRTADAVQRTFAAATGYAVREGAGLLVLDEVCAAIRCGFLDEQAVLDFLDGRPDTLEVVLTGRDPSEALQERADYITLSNNESGVAYAIRKFVLGSEA